MKATEFCYWLQGYFEIAEKSGECSGTLTSKQVDTVRRHLALVFKHELDPQHGPPEHQAVLQAIHDGTPTLGGVGPNGEIMRC